jgi:(2R)-ethylmalonyl-CoA mutase
MDRPWIMRTYSGHSSAEASNRLFRDNLARGQTGLSIAFDLPTQTGRDSDDSLAKGEVGKVGVPIGSIEDMERLFDGIPLDETNVSMTINATAPWLLALYIATAERRGIPRSALRGTVQNDLLKEFLSRGTYIFAPGPSMKLTTDIIEFTVAEMPRWNPINVCGYHLREAGATPVQEAAFTMATAIAVLDAVDVPPEVLPRVVGRVAFFCSSGIRFVEELCKMRAMVRLWDRICRERYRVDDAKLRRFRYGVQPASLELTAAQPENNVVRIAIEALGVLLSRTGRARALQLPCWNEALGLPRPIDQQWALRTQQILAFETDLLEYGDLFDGSPIIEERVTAMEAEAWALIERIDALGGAVAAVESGWIKGELVAANARRIREITTGERTLVGVNRFRESLPSPLVDGPTFLVPDPAEEAAQIERLEEHRRRRDQDAVSAALAALHDAVAAGDNVMPASIACAHAGVTTGEWTRCLAAHHGDYVAPTGLSGGASGADRKGRDAARAKVTAAATALGRPVRILIGKPGLDGHSNGAEQIALAARDAGMEVIYAGIRSTPAQIVSAAIQEDVHLVGLSVLSGSHLSVVPEIARGVDVPVVVGGIVPPADAKILRAAGVAAIYGPADRDLGRVIGDLADIAAGRAMDTIKSSLT